VTSVADAAHELVERDLLVTAEWLGAPAGG
jgi:hypothetical protein